ncbi:hypothetical protein OG760_17445 [Streptomyces sp. NBC_00963]|uniref:hypothetical protein n=1 Tax=Streptomyces sp. NBC_00963 TaxID=2903697 RepID=UPI003862ECDD|nr:hypothetical protein OG760_17445 [Streptomyces sp. NBC_00963]
MIRIVTAARLRQQDAHLERARDRARSVQAAADEQFAGHARNVRELTRRTEQAEGSSNALRAELDDVRAELRTAKATPQRVVVLLRYGAFHSLHLSIQAAEDHATSLGADPTGWRPATDEPAAQVAWLACSVLLPVPLEVA